MMNNSINIQDTVLEQLRREKMPVTVFLMKGVPLKGIVKDFDAYMVVIDMDGRLQMIFKHAISTVIPSRNVQMMSK